LKWVSFALESSSTAELLQKVGILLCSTSPEAIRMIDFNYVEQLNGFINEFAKRIKALDTNFE